VVPAIVFGATFLIAAGVSQLYEWPALRLDLLRIERLIQASLWGLLVAGLGVVALNIPGPSRAGLFGGWVLVVALIVAKRWMFGRWVGRRPSEAEKRILLLAEPTAALRIQEHFSRIPFVAFERFLIERWDPVTDGADELKRRGCAEIWLPASTAVSNPAFLAADGLPPVRILWDLWGAWGVDLEGGTARGWPPLRPNGMAGAIAEFPKRLFDLTFAAILLVLTAPVFIGVAVAIKATSRGPIFFRQTRMGRDDREFRIWKFRTMYVSAEQYATKPAHRRDPRITPVGQFLRQTGVDELPQILNVLRGEMSFVGPRPEMPFKVADYTPVERLRLRATPGITGLWQVMVHRSRDIRGTIEYDFYYLSRSSFLLDLLIIGATVVEIVKGVWGRSVFDA
jgi:lipopolysaccharide/colanic/teichoic acid biosynthesis glycosyltransferase